MADDNNSLANRLSRRQMLAMSGAAGVAAFAGCSGDTPEEGTGTGVGTGAIEGGGEGSASTSDDDSGNGLVDQSLTVPGRYVPTNLQWNSYAPSHYAQQGGKVVFDPFLRNNRKTGELIPYLFQDWSIDGKTLTVNIRENDTWHNGDPVTAEDVVTKFKIDKIFGYAVSDYISDAVAADETTVEYTMESNYRESVIMTTLSRSWLNTPTSRYGKFVERYDPEMSEEKLTQLQSDIQDYQPSEPLGSGPFKYESADQQVLTLAKFEDHASADQINFPYYEVEYMTSNQQQWAAMKNLSGLDATTTTFFPKRIRKSLPDAVQEFRIPSHNGYSIAFNHDDEDFGKRNVRRAIAHVIDQNRIATLVDDTKTAVKVPLGVGSFHNGTWDRYLGDNKDIYSSYTDKKKATQLLKSEGYEKRNGTWHKPNGDKFSFDIPVPAGWSDFVSMSRIISQMLTDFGIEATNQNVENTTFFGQHWGSSNFKIAPWFWNNSGQTDPFFTQSWILNSGTVKTNLNYPQEPKAPPMGKPDGKLETVDIVSKLQKLGTTSDEKEINQLVQELGWVINQSLPIYPVVEKQSQGFWNTNEWKVPEKGSSEQYVQFHYYWWPRVGAATARKQ
ncbi:ABC transporter substrate-binding protein [Halopelagius fulvigenes]|uniref:ABC transporter substrate-binding protein n=1 Tax=Halopelagius fulvigenes TaxID=1198324 RepID=A0ABD5TWP5_9EURY